MCVIVAALSGLLRLTDDQLAALLHHNPDGAGVMFAHDGELRLERERHADVAWIRAQFERVPGRRLAVLHLRSATQGTVCLENVQPITAVHEPQCRLALAHNGTLPRYESNSAQSDTARFARQFVNTWWQQHASAWNTPHALAELEAHVPEVNRVLLLDNRGEWAVIGEAEGFWRQDMWISNPKARAWLES